MPPSSQMPRLSVPQHFRQVQGAMQPLERFRPAASRRRDQDSECLFRVGPGRSARQPQGRKPVVAGRHCVEAIRAPSVRIELGAQDRRNILALTKQPDHIQMVAALEVAPQ